MQPLLAQVDALLHAEMKKFLQYTAVVVLALACIAPILLSYFAGGWAARYNPHSKVYTSTDLTGKVALHFSIFLYSIHTCGRYLPAYTSLQVAIVTGGNTGIGRQTVLELARCGARVILACRNQAQVIKHGLIRQLCLCGVSVWCTFDREKQPLPNWLIKRGFRWMYYSSNWEISILCVPSRKSLQISIPIAWTYLYSMLE